jgi:hypothetical protein
MQISGVNLTLTWPLRLCLLRVLLGASHCYKLSLCKHTGGGDTAPAFSGRRVYLQFTWEVGLPPFPVEFSYHHFYKLSRSWLQGMCCHHCLLQPACCEGFPLPTFSTQGTPPSLLHVFFVVIAYYSVSLFPLDGGWSVQGAMLIWPRVVCGSTTCSLAHLVVLVFPSNLGVGVWLWHGSPPGFSI